MTIFLKRSEDCMPHFVGRHPTGEVHSFLQASIMHLLLEPSSGNLTEIGVWYQDHRSIEP